MMLLSCYIYIYIYIYRLCDDYLKRLVSLTELPAEINL